MAAILSTSPSITHEFKEVKTARKSLYKEMKTEVIAHIYSFVPRSELPKFPLVDRQWWQVNIKVAAQERTQITALVAFIENTFSKGLIPKQLNLLDVTHWPDILGVNPIRINMQWREYIVKVLSTLKETDLIPYQTAINPVAKEMDTDSLPSFFKDMFTSALIYKRLKHALSSLIPTESISQKICQKLSTLQPIAKAIEAKEKILSFLSPIDRVKAVCMLLIREKCLNIAFSFVKYCNINRDNIELVLEYVGETLIQYEFIIRTFAIKEYGRHRVDAKYHIIKGMACALMNRGYFVKATNTAKQIESLHDQAAILADLACICCEKGKMDETFEILEMISKLQLLDDATLRKRILLDILKILQAQGNQEKIALVNMHLRTINGTDAHETSCCAIM